MRTVLSSPATAFHKLFWTLPGLGIGEGLALWHDRWVGLVWLLACVQVLRTTSWPLKQLACDDEHLYVSNLLREVCLPRSAIASAEVLPRVRIHRQPLVALHLRQAVFGSTEVRFLPAPPPVKGQGGGQAAELALERLGIRPR